MVLRAASLVILVGGGLAYAQRSAELSSPVSTPTDDRILSLLEIGTEMQVESRYAQAYSHFQTFAQQFPGNGPLMQAWALAARSAGKTDELKRAIETWDGNGGRPSPEMAQFISSYLQLFDVDISAPLEQVEQALVSVEQEILNSGLNIDQSSNLQLILSMIALRDVKDPSGSLTRAAAWIGGARALDPRDPTVAQLALVIDYLLSAQSLVERQRALSVDDVAQAGLEIGAIHSSRLPTAIRQRSADLMRALVLQQDRDETMPREYLRGLSNVIAIADLGVDAIDTAATTWFAASELDAFKAQNSFQRYGSFLGRFLSCYGDQTTGLNLLSRLETIQYEQSQNFAMDSDRAAAQQRLETLVLMWRFASRMRLGDEARQYRDQARDLSEQLANRTRLDLVKGPWVPIIVSVAVFFSVLATLMLLWYSQAVKPRRQLVTVPDGSQSATAAKLERLIRQVYARLVMRHNFWLLAWVGLGTLVLLLLSLGGMALLDRFRPDLYSSLFVFSDTWMVASCGIGFALVIGGTLSVFAVGRSAVAPIQVATAIDRQLGLKGIAETVYALPYLSSVANRSEADMADNSYLYSTLPNRVEQIRPDQLVRFLRPLALLVVALALTLATAISYQFLPLPKFDPVALPDPEICPPPNNNQPEPPPAVSLQPESAPQAGDGETGLDVNSSPVPEALIPALDGERNVGGVDDVGEPFDYHTTLPSREFDVERRMDAVRGLGPADDVPDGFAGSARQNVPDRFLGL